MATTPYTPTNFSIQQVFEILLQDAATNKVTAYLDDLKTSGVENSATLVYPTGARGNVYIGGAFAHSERFKLTVSKATWNANVLATQVGNTVTVGTNTNVIKYEVLTVATNKANTSFTALGVAGSEIGFVYVLDNSGAYTSTLVQDATIGSGKFTYTPGTKLITFNTSELSDGTRIAVAYKFTSGTSAKTIPIATDKFAGLQICTAYGLVKDLKDGSLYPMQIDGYVQIDPNWKWDLGSDKEPAVQDMNMEFVRMPGAQTKNLANIVIYNEADSQ